MTVVAIVLLAASLPLTWQIADVRAAQTADQHHPATVGNQLPANRSTTVSASGSSGRGADTDGDGISDAVDRCPRRPETKNGYRDGDGCPDTVTTTGAS